MNITIRSRPIAMNTTIRLGLSPISWRGKSNVLVKFFCVGVIAIFFLCLLGVDLPTSLIWQIIFDLQKLPTISDHNKRSADIKFPSITLLALQRLFYHNYKFLPFFRLKIAMVS
jgi:hypothetical protein